MSNNKDFIKFLKNIQYSSVSNINLKYNKVFKEFSVDTLIERNRFENTMQKKWIIEEENKTKSKFITTNDKLKQIINSHKNIYEIQQQFFKTFDKEPLFKKLINKEHAKEKLLKKSLKAKSNKIGEKMKNFLKMKEKEKNKIELFFKKNADIKINNKVKNDTCCICYDLKTDTMIFPCKHYFGGDCVKKLEENGKCPVCRGEILCDFKANN